MNALWAIPILTGTSVIAIGGALLLNRKADRMPLEARLRGISGKGEPPSIAAELGAGRITGLIKRIGEKTVPKKTSLSLREKLTQAGYHAEDAAVVYMGKKIIAMVLGLVLSPLLLLQFADGKLTNTTIYYLVFLITAILFFLPNAIVSHKRSKRRNLIRRHLPDAIDLLEICASAGMGLDQAWNAVTDEVRGVCPTLADEMALTNLEIHLGASRTDAMRHMAKRTGAEELSSLVAMLLQAERFGTSISEGLQNYATFMRETRSQRAQESAEKMAVKLIFPMVVAIFPAVVLLMAGPAFIALYHATRPN